MPKLNESKAKVIQENILQENPDGLPDEATGIVVAKHVPQMRRIKFLNGRDPGHELMFHYHSATHPLKHYTLYHGVEYDLPEEIIKHLEDCAERNYAYRVSAASGHPEMYIKSFKYIFQCKHVGKAA